MPELSGRQAAWVKGGTLAAMERERKAALTRIRVLPTRFWYCTARRAARASTGNELWNARKLLGIDPGALREEVSERAARIARQLQHRGKPADLAERLAIEQTLESRGYLRREIGGWC